MRKLLPVLLVFALTAGLLAACAKPAPSPTPTGAATPVTTPTATPKASPTPVSTPAVTPREGGIFRLIESTDVRVFGYVPEIVGVAHGHAFPAMVSLLNADKTGRLMPKLATSWQTGADGKSFTLTLRKGVRFHDGTPLDAEVVKWNLELAKAARQTGLDKITSIDVIDDYTVRLNLSQFTNDLTVALVRISGIQMSRVAVEKNGKEWARFNPVGAGPFKFKGVQTGSYIEYERFDAYYEGKPYLDGVKFVIIVDRTTGSLAFQRGEADEIRPDIKEAVELESKGFKLIGPSYGSTDALVPDTANPDSIFRDKRVREAVEYAIDRQAITKSVGYGKWEALNQIAPSTYMGYNRDYKGRPYNPARAKELLTAAGYPNGFNTEIIFQNTRSDEAFVAVQQFLAEVGIKAKLTVVPSAKWTELTTKGWKNALFGNNYGGLDPNFISVLVRQYAPITETQRLFSMERPAVLSKLLDDARAAQDYETNNKLTQAAVKFMSEEAMFVPLWIDVSYAVQQPYVRDTGRYTLAGNTMWTPEKTWLSK
ncbi:MAG: ABC transporter substrate-binding protein [Chloroflexi bacterium]|nr:ABC transporter substrate-binding protein [Chloroflexota bacterium]